MVLRLPRTFIDTSLLEDEPFRFAFSATKRTRGACGFDVQSVLEGMHADERGLDAATVWVHHALREPAAATLGSLSRATSDINDDTADVSRASPTRDEAPEMDIAPSNPATTITIPGPPPTETELGIFVEFFRLLHVSRGATSGAEAYLNSECKKRNIDYRPDLRRVLVRPEDVGAIVVVASEEDEAAGEKAAGSVMREDKGGRVEAQTKDDGKARKQKVRRKKRRRKGLGDGEKDGGEEQEGGRPMEEVDADIEDNTVAPDSISSDKSKQAKSSSNKKTGSKKVKCRRKRAETTPLPQETVHDATSCAVGVERGRKRKAMVHSTSRSSLALSLSGSESSLTPVPSDFEFEELSRATGMDGQMSTTDSIRLNTRSNPSDKAKDGPHTPQGGEDASRVIPANDMPRVDDVTDVQNFTTVVLPAKSSDGTVTVPDAVAPIPFAAPAITTELVADSSASTPNPASSFVRRAPKRQASSRGALVTQVMAKKEEQYKRMARRGYEPGWEMDNNDVSAKTEDICHRGKRSKKNVSHDEADANVTSQSLKERTGDVQVEASVEHTQENVTSDTSVPTTEIRKTTKKPKFRKTHDAADTNEDSIVVPQVAKRRKRKNKSTVASSGPLAADLALTPPSASTDIDANPAIANSARSAATSLSPTDPLPRKTTKKPRLGRGGNKTDGISPQVAKRRKRNDGSASGISGEQISVAVTVSGGAPEATRVETNENLSEDMPIVTRANVTGTSSGNTSDTVMSPQAAIRGRKRKRAALEGDTPKSSGTLSRGGGADGAISQPRSIVTRPTVKQGLAMQKPIIPAPSPSSNCLGMTSAAVDDLVRHSAVNALLTLRSPVESASEWEVWDPDNHPYDSDSDDEWEPLSRPVVRKTTGKSSRASHKAMDTSAPILPQKRATSSVSATMPNGRAFSASISPSEMLPIPARVLPPKRPLERYPPIWAESRQEVCESFDWFRSYQGGVYFIKGQVKGYLLGGFSASRDVFHDNGKLIISHGGGKAESIHTQNGQHMAQEASDQLEEDKSVRALLHTCRMKRPVVLLIDDKYELFPLDLSSKGCTYAVLGWYRIAHAWAEYQDATNSTGRVIRYKFAFQWCREQGQPWWSSSTAASQDPSLPAGPGGNPSATIHEDVATPESVLERKCSVCKRPSPAVYEQGWMCLKPGCNAFFQPDSGIPPPAHLTYSSAFLRPVQFPEESLEELIPPPPVDNFPVDGATTTRHYCKGWHCSNCGRLSSRYKWEHWECRTCGAQFGGYGRSRTADEFRLQTNVKMFNKHAHHPSIIQSPYRTFSCGKSFGHCVTFILPYGRGRIHLLLSPPLMSTDADCTLLDYQDEARDGSLKFRRWPMRAHKCRGTLLTNYFSQNTGEPYQYVGGTANTVPFDRAPKAVVQALDLIKLRMKEASLNLGTTFNEVLSAAYMEEQKMAFHSDSERGLGPVVASLSLGAAAYMHFRLHARYAADEMPEDTSRDVLKLYLCHGDVVVMEGDGVQEFYEHTVVPLNFRIAATARFIGAENQSVYRQ